MFVSEPLNTVPAEFKSDLQKNVYQTLGLLNMPFLRVDCDPAITMEDCLLIDERLQMQTVKTIFLTNRQKNAWWLFVTKADKPFVTKDFSAALNIPRVSFAPADMLLDMLGTPVGATTVLSVVQDVENKVQVVIDNDVMVGQDYGCTDGTTTSYMKLNLKSVMETYLNHCHHTPIFINI
ncbi:MAG: prolyl-tRNA synthetase associated domain-containing protein [Paludibacteraceae bacterium]|nr:prolyl-tRNA synthetase associated domain-containing protein [Paludibacteraceae bacterium]